jgi:hypothetical protein
MKKLTDMIFKVLFGSALMLPMLTSCYDDTAIWDKFDKIEHRLDSLENSLNEQFQALNSLIDSKTTIASCETNSDGSYKVTLSNGIKFTVLPDGTKFSSLVSVVNVDGVQCWATYVNGELTPLKDTSGKPIPVVKDEYRTQVEVAVEDGKYYLVIDGKKYMTGYDVEDMVQVFSSCETHKDATGNIYAMTFTFGEGMKVTVAVDGYNGVIFKLANAAGNSTVLTEYYINYKETQPILLEKAGVVDYVMQIPDGWRVTERTDEYTAEVYLDITAPAAETIQTGAAVANGDLKVVAVLEGGKAAVSKLALSAEPFKTFNISGTKAVIEPYKGVQKYVYGIMPLDGYSEETLLAEVTEILGMTGDIPAGFAIAETGINLPHAEILGAELDSRTAYIFWAIPALYREGDNGGYYVKEGMFKTHRLAPISVNISKPETSLLDAQIKIEVDGTNAMYAGTSLKSDDLFKNIIYQINNGIAEPVDAIASYEGSASAFPSEETNAGTEFIPATTYVTWVVPVEEEKTQYSENDIIYQEFTTNSITSGGSLKVSLGESVTDRTTITFPATSEGAELIYYAWFDTDRYLSVDNDSKAELILKSANCTVAKGRTTDARIERVKPNKKMYMMIMAVDKDGKYGEVATASATTQNITYNALTVSVNVLELGSDKASFKFESTGGTASEYLYWFGKESDNFWKNSNYLGENRNNAYQYMALYPEDENIIKCMNRFGSPAEDGTITFDGLNMTTNYVLMVLAKDESGLYSKGAYKMITTLAADLGNIVRADSEAWTNAKNQIQINWLKDRFEKAENSYLSSAFTFEFSCPKNLTAYIASLSENYYTNNPDFITIEDVMINIEAYASRYSEMGNTPTYFDEAGHLQLVTEPDWYDNNGEAHGGFLMNIYKFNIHGYPEGGYVTYFAEGSHNADNCNNWDKAAGNCSNYEKASRKLAELCSLEYWTEHMKEFRSITNEESIRKNGQAYYEAYYSYYKDAKPRLFVNNGGAVTITQPYAIGPDDTGYVADAVIVMLKDLEGNYYEPMYFPVPNYFTGE